MTHADCDEVGMLIGYNKMLILFRRLLYLKVLSYIECVQT